MSKAFPPFVTQAARALAKAFHARGVMLFGSRARGDAKDDDDWDVAVVLREFSPLPDATRLDAIVANDIVHARAISQDELFEKSTDGDHVASAMAHDGILLVGHISLPAAAMSSNIIRELTKRSMS